MYEPPVIGKNVQDNNSDISGSIEQSHSFIQEEKDHLIVLATDGETIEEEEHDDEEEEDINTQNAHNQPNINNNEDNQLSSDDEVELKMEQISNTSNNLTNKEENQITTNNIDGSSNVDNENDGEEVKYDPTVLETSVTKYNHSDRISTYIQTKTEVTYKKPAFNYWFVSFVSLIFFSFGYIIYIFTTFGWIVLLSSTVGFITSVTKEYIHYTNAKKSDDLNHDDASEASENTVKHDLNEVFDCVWDKEEQKFSVYVATEFSNTYVEEVDETEKQKKHKIKVNVTGATRVYHRKQNGVIVVEKRALYIFENYQGYETIGGISSFNGFLITIIAAIVKLGIKSQTNGKSEWFIAMLTVIFITVVCACVGCVIEIELRKYNKLAPNKKLTTTSTTVPLHEIISVDLYSISFHQNLQSNLKTNNTFVLRIQRYAIAWFEALVGVFKLFVYIYKALYVNSAFVLFVIIFILVPLLFELAINKESSLLPNLPVAIMIMLWIAFCVGIFSVHHTLQLSDSNRMNKRTQSCLFILFSVSTILISIAAILMSGVVGNLYDLTSQRSDLLTSSTLLIDKIVCYSEEEESSDVDRANIVNASETSTMEPFMVTNYTNITSTIAAIDTTTSVYSDLCDDDNKWSVLITLLLVCIIWYLMLIAAYCWNQNDNKRFTKVDSEKAPIREWTKFSAIRIGLKSHKSSSFFGSNSREIVIELDAVKAHKLHEYLNDNVPWFSIQTGDKMGTMNNQLEHNSNNHHVTMSTQSGNFCPLCVAALLSVLLIVLGLLLAFDVTEKL